MQIDFFHRVFGQKMCGKSWRITWVVPRRNYSNFRSNDVLFLEKWRVVFRKMTCCFRKNDVLFLEKWRVVFGKMTCCFWKNDVLFLEKWRVVFEKVTCCFRKSDVSFLRMWRVVLRECGEGGEREERKVNCKNTCNSLLLRVRTRARFTRVFAFLLSQVSRTFGKLLEIS